MSAYSPQSRIRRSLGAIALLSVVLTGALATPPASAQPSAAARWPVAPVPVGPAGSLAPDSTGPTGPTAAASPAGSPAPASPATSRNLRGRLGALPKAGTAGRPAGVPDQSGPSASRQGTLDRTFGQQGVTLTPFPGRSSTAADVALLRDGSIIAAGGSPQGDSPDFLLARYSRNGVLDGTFGDHGLVVTPWTAARGAAGAEAAAVGAKDRIAVAGTVGLGQGDDIGFGVAVYRPDGSLDPTFGNGGKVITPVGPVGDAGASAVAFQPDGKIVVTGGADDAQLNPQFAAARYLPDGRLDPTFGTGGTTVITIPGGDANSNAVVLQRDGKIVIAGTGSQNGRAFCLVRLTSGGALDPGFGNHGIVLEQFSPGATVGDALSVALAPGGRIVAGGNGGVGLGSFGLMRFLGNGALDPTFGGGTGKVLTEFDAASIAERVLVRRDGSIVAVGLAGQATATFALVGYRPNGDLDPAFGDGGRTTTALGANSGAFGAVLQSTGKIVAVGGSGSAEAANFAIARYLGPSRKKSGHQDAQAQSAQAQSAQAHGTQAQDAQVQDAQGRARESGAAPHAR